MCSRSAAATATNAAACADGRQVMGRVPCQAMGQPGTGGGTQQHCWLQREMGIGQRVLCVPASQQEPN